MIVLFNYNMDVDTDNDALTKLVQSEAKSRGISSKDAKKAIKKIRGGGIMAQVAPHLHSQFMEMNPNLTPRDKLRMKMKKMKDSRGSKHAKAISYEKERQEVHEKQQKEQEEKERTKKAEIQRKKNHTRKIKQLGKQLGTVTQELYNACMLRINKNEYQDPGMKHRDQNIVELYGQQQQFVEEINMDDLDI